MLEQRLHAHEQDTTLQRTPATDSGDADWPDAEAANARLQAELNVSQQRRIDLQRRVDKLTLFFTESSAHFRAAARDVLGWRFDPDSIETTERVLWYMACSRLAAFMRTWWWRAAEYSQWWGTQVAVSLDSANCPLAVQHGNPSEGGRPSQHLRASTAKRQPGQHPDGHSGCRQDSCIGYIPGLAASTICTAARGPVWP